MIYPLGFLSLFPGAYPVLNDRLYIFSYSLPSYFISLPFTHILLILVIAILLLIFSNLFLLSHCLFIFILSPSIYRLLHLKITSFYFLSMRFLHVS